MEADKQKSKMKKKNIEHNNYQNCIIPATSSKEYLHDLFHMKAKAFFNWWQLYLKHTKNLFNIKRNIESVNPNFPTLITKLPIDELSKKKITNWCIFDWKEATHEVNASFIACQSLDKMMDKFFLDCILIKENKYKKS